MNGPICDYCPRQPKLDYSSPLSLAPSLPWPSSYVLHGTGQPSAWAHSLLHCSRAGRALFLQIVFLRQWKEVGIYIWPREVVGAVMCGNYGLLSADAWFLSLPFDLTLLCCDCGYFLSSTFTDNMYNPMHTILSPLTDPSSVIQDN